MSLQAAQPPKAAVAALKSMIGAHLSRTVGAKAPAYKRVRQVPVYVIDQIEPVA
jgi:hypothetical protein